MTLAMTGTKTDQQLQLDVQAELNRDWRFKPAEIGVEVDQGVVTLTGTVSTYSKIGQAVEASGRVAGVTDVANKLAVQGPATSDDTQIAQAVREALLWDADVPAERIESIVREGVVTLKGSVDHNYERLAAHDAVARLTGVRALNNDVVVVPTGRTDEEIFEDTKATLGRCLPTLEIDVAVDRGAVTLMGKVDSYRSRSDAEKAASSTRGVTKVVNKIIVRPLIPL